MRKWGALLSLVAVLALSLVFAASAFATVTISVADPDAAYIAETSRIDFSSIPLGTPVTSVTDGHMTVTFDAFMTPWAVSSELWGNPGEVEDAHPVTLQTPPPDSARSMQLSLPVHELGFEAAGLDYGSTTLDVTFKVMSGGDELATITRTIASPFGDLNARLFAIKSDAAFDRVEIAIDNTSGFALTQLRYSEAEAPNVSGTVKNGATGVPVPYAHVYAVYADAIVAEVDANAQGAYSLVLPPGTYTFYASARGWGETGEDVTVPVAGLTKDLTLTEQYEQAVYRFFNMKGGVHFYTANDAEFLNTLNNLRGTFSYDGIAYYVGVREDEDLVPLYRFYNPGSGVHFYTASEAEKDNVVRNLSHIYVFEGVAYGVRIDGVGTPVYRYYVPSRNTHFYSADTSEIGFDSKLSNTYRYEGIGYWVGGARRR